MCVVCNCDPKRAVCNFNNFISLRMLGFSFILKWITPKLSVAKCGALGNGMICAVIIVVKCFLDLFSVKFTQGDRGWSLKIVLITCVYGNLWPFLLKLP